MDAFELAVTDDQGLGIAPVKIFQQSHECRLLCLGTRVGRMTADVEPALVADADGVGVVVAAVGANHPFRTARLDLSVTTDNVVVADAEVEPSLAVPGVDLGGRTRLVGPHCRTVKDYKCNASHNLHAALHQEG